MDAETAVTGNALYAEFSNSRFRQLNWLGRLAAQIRQPPKTGRKRGLGGPPYNLFGLHNLQICVAFVSTLINTLASSKRHTTKVQCAAGWKYCKNPL